MLDVATIFAGSLESIEMIHVYFGGTRLPKMREEMFHGGAQKWGHLEFLSPPPLSPTTPPCHPPSFSFHRPFLMSQWLYWRCPHCACYMLLC